MAEELLRPAAQRLGALLEEQRRGAGISRKVAAKHLGMGVAYLLKIEREGPGVRRFSNIVLGEQPVLTTGQIEQIMVLYNLDYSGKMKLKRALDEYYSENIRILRQHGRDSNKTKTPKGLLDWLQVVGGSAASTGRSNPI
jgi:hypothetical protein